MADEDFTPPLKTCKKCGQTKPKAEFFKAPECKDGLRGDCKLCNLARQAKYCAENRDAISAQKKRKYDAADADARSARNAVYYTENADKIKSRAKAWEKENSDYAKLRKARYWIKNHTYLLEMKAKYRESNRDLLRIQSRMRNATSDAKEKRAAYVARNFTVIKEKKRRYNKANEAKLRVSQAAYRLANAEKIKIAAAKWRMNNPDGHRVGAHNRRVRIAANGGKLSIGLAKKLFVLQKGKCPCCARPLGSDYHMDHKMPLALGGSNTDGNMQLLRKTCNLNKSAKHPVDFMQSRGFLL